MKLARDHGLDGTPPGVRPEDPYFEVRPAAPNGLKLRRAALVTGAIASLAAAGFALFRRRA